MGYLQYALRWGTLSISNGEMAQFQGKGLEIRPIKIIGETSVRRPPLAPADGTFPASLRTGTI